MSRVQRVSRATKDEMLTRTAKQCGTCLQLKPLTNFHRSRYHGDGHKTECKDCRSADSHKRYIADTIGHQTKMRDRYERSRQILRAAKAQACADCNCSYPPPVMHFHHRDPSDKVREVAKLVNHAEATLRAEIAKCDVVCSNCHILRHIAESQVVGI